MRKPWSAKTPDVAIAWPRFPAPKRAMLCCPEVRRIFRISAIFDVDPGRVGSRLGDLTVRNYDELNAVVTADGVMVGVLAVPGSAAQSVADDLVAAGVKIIFNYSDALLSVPSDVTVHTSSPAVELLYALYFYLT